MHPRSDCAVVACLAILLSACAAREALTRYPRAEIDQPYTLPQGVRGSSCRSLPSSQTAHPR